MIRVDRQKYTTITIGHLSRPSYCTSPRQIMYCVVQLARAPDLELPRQSSLDLPGNMSCVNADLNADFMVIEWDLTRFYGGFHGISTGFYGELLGFQWYMGLLKDEMAS